MPPKMPQLLTPLDPVKLPKNLILYTLALFDPASTNFGELSKHTEIWAGRDNVASLAGYSLVVDAVFDFLKEATIANPSTSRNAIADEIFENLCEDIQALHEHLLDLLHTPDNYKDFLTSPEDQAQQLLDLIQEMLDLFPDSTERPVLSKALLRLSRASGRLPTCFPLSGLQKVGKQVAAGGFGDIWKGLIRGQSVSVKIMRLFRDSDIRDILHTFGREALIWRQLSHPNVLPFFGLYYLDSRLCLVSPWMADGHVLEYLKTAPPDTDRVSLMLDVALGLEYLHENNVVHGDLKAMNILVTPSHRACVADFGLSSITDAMTLKFTHSTASVRGGTTRYQAPELISTDNLSQCSSDVYAFACVCYEIWTEQRPFFEITQDVYVAIKILSGLRPTRPENMTDDHPLWLLLQDSWVKDPTERPTITQIVHRLVDPIGATIRSYGSADWEDSFSSKLRRSLQDWPLLPSVAKIKKRIFANDHVDPDVEMVYTGPDPTTSCSECSARLTPSSSFHETDTPRPTTPLPPISSLFTLSHKNHKPRKSRLQSIYIPISCITANHYVPIRTDSEDTLVEVFVSTHDLEVHQAVAGTAHNLPSLPQMSASPTPRSSPISSPRPAQVPDFATLCRQYLDMIHSSQSGAPATARTSTPRPDPDLLFLTGTSPRIFSTSPDLELGGRTLVDDALIPEFPPTPVIRCRSSLSSDFSSSDPVIDSLDRWSESAADFDLPLYQPLFALPPETPSVGESLDSPLLIRGPFLRKREEEVSRQPAKRRRTEPVMSIRSLCE